MTDDTRSIRWGILSTADIALKQVGPAIQASHNGELAAVASRDADKAKAFAEALGIPRAHDSYEALLVDPEIDAIYNPLPVSHHCAWSIKAAEAGKPVLCEKPFAKNAAEAREMAAAFRERGIPLAEAFMYRFHPMTRRVKAMVTSGELGKIVAIRATFNVKSTPPNIRLQRGTGGGAMRDVGCYCVNLMRHFTGEEPVDLAATGTFGGEDGVDETVAGSLGFPSGAVGSFCCSVGAAFDCSYEIFGTEARVIVDKGTVPGPNDAVVIKLWKAWQVEEIAIPAANHYQLMVEDFADALLNERPVKFAPGDAVANMEVIDRILTVIGDPDYR